MNKEEKKRPLCICSKDVANKSLLEVRLKKGRRRTNTKFYRLHNRVGIDGKGVFEGKRVCPLD